MTSTEVPRPHLETINLSFSQSDWISISNIPVPPVKDNHVLVKVQYVAQFFLRTQPTGISALSISPPGALSGCDYAGTVIKLGPNLNTPLKIGDKVAGCISGGSSTVEGSYAQYAVVESDMCFVVPEGMPLEEGRRLGLGDCCSVSGNPWYIIYGPSTSVGLFPTSLGKALGYRVLGICSPQSFSLVKSYSADVTIDYHNQSQAISEALDLAGGGFWDDCQDDGPEGKAVELYAVRTGRSAQDNPRLKIEFTAVRTLWGADFKWGLRDSDKVWDQAEPYQD
ncbi:hypothetical protein LQV05_004393 [Cryptococcus neoformans]|nr:hypothetical protein LQV05_004393 [Cryptococcus neoformans]